MVEKLISWPGIEPDIFAFYHFYQKTFFNIFPECFIHISQSLKVPTKWNWQKQQIW